jgi:cytochrome P450
VSTAQPSSPKKTLFTEALLENPYPIYQRFLEQGPIHYIDRGPGPGIWAVFSYASCVSVLKDHRLTAKRSDAMLLAFPPEKRAEFAPLAHLLGLWMLSLMHRNTPAFASS